MKLDYFFDNNNICFSKDNGEIKIYFYDDEFTFYFEDNNKRNEFVKRLGELIK